MATAPAGDAKTRALQTLLRDEGLYKGRIDGIDGPQTDAATIALQLRRGGTSKRRIDLIVVHCTATREGQQVNAAEITRWHKAKGWADIGYHWVHLLDGTIEPGRGERTVGAHVEGHNARSIGVVYVGGLAVDGRTPKDTRTAAQRESLAQQLTQLAYRYPGAVICGHRDLSPDRDGDGVVEPHEWLKACPSFDARAFARELHLPAL